MAEICWSISYVILYLTYLQMSFAEVTVLPMTCKDKKTIVDAHNYVRLAVASGKLGSQPKASNLQRLMWDDEVASMAKKHAALGVFEHSKETKLESRRFYVGENLFTLYSTRRGRKLPQNWNQAVNSWAMEHDQYSYAAVDMENYADTGHYTQMVWASTQFIGCAVANVTDTHTLRLIYVCNYGPTGNVLGQTPYELGVGCKHLCCTKNCLSPYGYECNNNQTNIDTTT